MKKTYGYSRVSTQRQADQGASLEAQKQQLKEYHEYALKPKGFVWAGHFSDAAQSGKTPLLSRKAGKKLDAILETGDAVVISRLDRGFRSVTDLLQTVDTWNAKQISVHLLDLNLDSSTPVGRLIMTVIGCVAEFEGRLRQERVQLSMNHIRSKGFFAGPWVPYGFLAKGPRCKRRLYPDKQKRELARKMLEWQAAGWSNPQIYLHLFKTGLRYNGKEVTLAQVRHWTEREVLLQEKEANDAAHREASGSATG
jgi:DNA invertase Pin-like site-specific DNA recombinase